MLILLSVLSAAFVLADPQQVSHVALPAYRLNRSLLQGDPNLGPNMARKLYAEWKQKSTAHMQVETVRAQYHRN